MNAWLQALMMSQQLNRPNPQTLAPGNFGYGAAGPAPWRQGPTNALIPSVSQQLLSFGNRQGFRGYVDDNTFYGDTSPTGSPDWTFVGNHQFDGSSTNPKGGHTSGTQSTKIWKRTTPKAADPAPAPAAPAPAAAPAQAPASNAPGNPQLQIPGINVRLTGEQVGIKPAESTARREKQTSKGSSRLTIPRSSGASGLNLGM
jgi:hypothetical protein